jgi:hypothetical protein
LFLHPVRLLSAGSAALSRRPAVRQRDHRVRLYQRSLRLVAQRLGRLQPVEFGHVRRMLLGAVRLLPDRSAALLLPDPVH